MTDVAPLLDAAVRTATPLLIAAMGETISERAGAINIGLEGCIIAGAFAAFAVGSVVPDAGFPAAVAAGLAVGVVMVVFSIVWRRDQIIVGTALTMLALGLTGTLFRARGGDAERFVATQPVLEIPMLADIPVLGHAFFGQPPVAYVAFLLVPATWWFLRKTQAGLALRAVGEAPAAATAAGVHVTIVRSCAVLYGSALGGLAGGALVLAQAGTFAEGMSAGRGFLVIAIVALGRWRAGGVALASFVFGTAMALQFVVQALGWSVRYELVLMIPYVLTLVALGAVGRGAAPAMLGRAIDDE